MLGHSTSDAAAVFLKDQVALPTSPETATIALGNEKIAALVFDRVWSPFEVIVPDGIRFSGQTIHEWQAVHDALELAGKNWEKIPEMAAAWQHRLKNTMVSEEFTINVIPKNSPQPIDETNTPIPVEVFPFTRGLTELYFEKLKLKVVPVYDSKEVQSKNYTSFAPRRMMT